MVLCVDPSEWWRQANKYGLSGLAPFWLGLKLIKLIFLAARPSLTTVFTDDNVDCTWHYLFRYISKVSREFGIGEFM